MKMIKFLSLIIGLLFVAVSAVAQMKIDTGKLQQANRYFQEHEYKKAAVLYREIYNVSGSKYYFESYLNCLIELSDFEQAEKDVKREIRHAKDKADLYVQWGYLLKKQNRFEEANDKFVLAAKLMPDNRVDITRLANAFLSKREFEWAEKVYLNGRKNLTNENFNYELARVYLYQRNYERMMDEYLELLKQDAKNILRVQSGVRSAMRADVDNTLQVLLRNLVLKRIQAEPGVVEYNRLLIWLFMQEEMFPQALRQAIALDKRSGDDDLTIYSLAKMAGTNNAYSDALKAYNYLIEKGKAGKLFYEAYRARMQLLYSQYLLKDTEALSIELLEDHFRETFHIVGKTPESVNLLKDFAHFLTFFLDKPDEGIQLIEEGVKIPRLQKIQRDHLRNELADIYVYNDDLWEAVLLYSQLAEANRDNELGDEVKLKKARLGYFMGNMSWAQAQLDVIKASTSKLVANDALELSIFISNNTNLDTTDVPMQQFARADLYTFRNQGEKAWMVLDSIEHDFPYHSLLDDILFRKAKIKALQGDYEGAASFLEKLLKEYSYDLLGDDALFMLAGIYEKQLNQKEKAEELYKKMLVDYPASIYVTKSREKYRQLRGDFEGDPETEFFEGGSN